MVYQINNKQELWKAIRKEDYPKIEIEVAKLEDQIKKLREKIKELTKP